jgi:hypothetical protein
LRPQFDTANIDTNIGGLSLVGLAYENKSLLVVEAEMKNEGVVSLFSGY